ncbi:MAG: nicotinate (nicotinamide) nucleotide adenylyltransferase [Treponema sp.]|nr:nicotinate (nicotinamide) nucleotide adenylyltransferase [Treponema sp.]
MKLGILGGSFNPVHLGHLFLADTALCALKLDRVVMIPACRSPFKPDAEGMENSAGTRVEMLAAAIAGDSRLVIDACEIKREGISYTVDTLEDIIARYIPDGKPALIIGDDLAVDFPKWRDSEKILKLADVVIARRLNSAAVDYPFPHTLINNEVMNISSHAIRKKISEGKDWRSLVPAGAAVIIEDRRLYGFSGAGAGEECSHALILRVEAAARETLSIERFIHSRNTAILAHDLCRRFNINPMSGYLAGIAHDLAKQLDSEQMMKLAKKDKAAITELEKEKPNLLHGRAAAVLLRERFCVHNEDVLEAVAVHTSGRENMCSLAKIIYIADKLEFSRNIDPAARKICNGDDLDNIFFTVFGKTVSKLQSRDLNLTEETLRLLDRMKEKNR